MRDEIKFTVLHTKLNDHFKVRNWRNFYVQINGEYYEVLSIIRTMTNIDISMEARTIRPFLSFCYVNGHLPVSYSKRMKASKTASSSRRDPYLSHEIDGLVREEELEPISEIAPIT